MKPPDVIAIDFETHPIAGRPNYPPEPVGVAIKWPGSEAVYLAWGHPTGNNCDVAFAIGELRAVWNSSLPVVMHNAKFDLAVCYEKLGLPELPWERVHDTMFLAYLFEPHSRSLGLKPLAADLLKWPADERNAVDGWIWDNRKRLAESYGGSVVKSKLGAWIWATPAELCGEYAVGDVARTIGLFNYLWPRVQKDGMGAAYDRERQLLPILMENERDVMRVDMEGLDGDLAGYDAALEYVERWLRGELKASGLNFDADRDVAAVLLERGVVLAENWSKTESGQLSMSKETLLPEHFTDPRIASALGYRNRLKTCTEMFMRPWLAQAEQRGGFISTNWNQVRGPGGGTRTGRPSTSDPNFLNISKDFEGRTDGYIHPAFLGVPTLPLVRKYILPDEGHTFLHRDFDGQELRVFAHFEQGALWAAYQGDASLDPHAFVGDELRRMTGQELERTKIKVLNFQALYGGGIPAAQRKLNCSYAEAKQYKAFHDQALPGRVVLNDEIKKFARMNWPIRTWGGRLYFCEPPAFSKKYERTMTYDYKLLNYLVQGSAADLTKQAIIDWYSVKRDSRFLVTVYDEINISAPHGSAASEMALLRDVMEANRLTVPMRSSGKQGPTWGDLTKCP